MFFHDRIKSILHENLYECIPEGPPVQYYKMILAYDGTAYAGWQSQPDGRGIADVIQKTFLRVFHHPIKLSAASRTDAGVHAYGQVATFSTVLNATPEKIRYGLQNSLPADIVIRSLKKVQQRFHPRYDVVQKTYHYYFTHERPLPPWHRCVWYVRTPLQLELLQKTLQLFVGKHDFYAFCADGDTYTTVRIIDALELERYEPYQGYRIVCKGKSFARHLIRRLVGAAISVATPGGSATYDDVQNILHTRQSNNTVPKAPAQGLVLYEVKY